MGIPVIQYGSLFLIRNGFRVFPIGEEANDYWGFDRRKQQGYARFLGSRDLLGFINISGDEDKFAESSSRNQGLIQTKAAIELSDCVKRCLVKLEAYVVDITWADKLDKTYNNAQRMGLDDNRYKIIELIEKLSKSKNIDVINYNHDLISILNKKAERFAPSLKKLQNIADNLNDKELIKQIELAKKTLTKANVAQQEAEKNAEEERQARKKAEKKAEKSEIAYQEEIKRNIFLTGSESRDKELLEGFIHQIILYASQSKGSLQNILQSPTKLKKMSVKELKESFSKLLEITEKIISTSRFATTANFRLQSSMINEDFNAFVKEYLEKIATAYNSRIDIVTKLDTQIFELKFNPIEIGMVLENFISNAKKARAMTITFTSIVKYNVLKLIVKDDGKGINKQIIEKKRIFEKGFTRTDGSGLGLYFCKNQIESLGGELKLSEMQPKQGLSFTIKVAK